MTKVKRTYSSRSRLSLPSSSPSSSPPSTTKRKRFGEGVENEPPTKKRITTKTSPSGRSAKPKQCVLRQLHFSIETSVLRTCTICGLSYTRGAPDDESLHRAHCSRVQRGMEWGREEEREAEKVGVEEIQSAAKLKDGKKGRIICFKANVGGRVGSKLAILLETINLALSSPPLSTDILQSSKAYLYLIPSLTNAHREKIVGCVIAQRISTAMTVAAPSETLLEHWLQSTRPQGSFAIQKPCLRPSVYHVYLSQSAHRRQGIASRLLSAAAATFIHGCPLDPVNGDVAFTQPTEGGHAVMQQWGGGGVRIYEE
ncbi:hypothetical protein F4604DRAFT_1920823 [Suillus subluteus]|nr:hypothetical protein F4604DRAFT_1920823 [Suillus subluteus]